MCEFVTAILPHEVDLDRAKEMFLRHKRGFELLDNYRIAEFIDKTNLYILTTLGMCDCGTSLGSFAPSPLPGWNEARWEKYRQDRTKKLKAKGWSDNKIRRKFEQEAASQTEYEQRTDQREDEDIISWLDLISDLLKSKITNRLGLLVHTYHTGVENERLTKLGSKTIPFCDLNSRVLLETQKDVIYQFIN